MRAHVLNVDGVIVNTVVTDSLSTMPNLVDASIGGVIGDQIINGALAPKPPGSSLPPPTPKIVTMRQARLALFDAGLLDAVEPMIAAIADEDHRLRAQIEWASANDVERDNPFTAFLAAALGLSDAELDQLFRTAAYL